MSFIAKFVSGAVDDALAASGIKESMCAWYAQMYQDTLENFQIGKVISEIFTGGSSYKLIEDNLVNFITGDITNVMTSVALALAVLFFAISLLDLAMTDRFTLEYFIKFFSKFAASLILIVSCSEITKLISDFASSFCELIGASLLDGDSIKQIEGFGLELYKALIADENLQWIALVVSGALNIGVMKIVAWAMVVIVYLVGFTRLFEMIIRGAFMPISFALLADDGWRGAGGRYIRKYMAICCQSTVLCIIGGIHSQALKIVMVDQLERIQDAAVSGSQSGEMVMLFGLSFAAVSLMFKSIGIINDVFGA